jgi:beta-glucosidase
MSPVPQTRTEAVLALPERTPTGWRFPLAFRFGVATSAYQIEGATDADGRGRSIWDTFCDVPGAIERGESGNTACDHYHRWRADVALLRDMGVSSYRFSIAWPRVQPTGRGTPNIAGLGFYDRLVDELLAAGIRPFPTLYHWDLPQALEDAGGWPARDVATRFAEYAAVCARALGDRVHDWALFNEPFIFVSRGYLLGRYAPGRKDPAAFLRAVHTVALAHGDGFRAVKSERPAARVGTVVALSPCEPATDTDGDRAAATNADAHFNLLQLDPLFFGGYPKPFADHASARQLGWKRGDNERMCAPIDFIGVNCYYRLVISVSDGTPKLPFHLIGPRSDTRPGGGHGEFGGETHAHMHVVESAFGRPVGPRTDMDWEVWPHALYEVMHRLRHRYGAVPIDVTESGCAFPDTHGPDGEVHDDARIAYHREHLGMVAQAMREGVDVRSYHAWSFMDNFEWASGYRPRFGLVHVDYATQRRTVKASGKWYARVCRSHGVD